MTQNLKFEFLKLSTLWIYYLIGGAWDRILFYYRPGWLWNGDSCLLNVGIIGLLAFLEKLNLIGDLESIIDSFLKKKSHFDC